MYVFLSGQGEARGPEGTEPVAAGDHLLFPPGEAHQIINTGGEDLVYYVIADHHPAEVTSYPDTGRWGIKPQRKHFEMTEAPYFEPGD